MCMHVHACACVCVCAYAYIIHAYIQVLKFAGIHSYIRTQKYIQTGMFSGNAETNINDRYFDLSTLLPVNGALLYHRIHAFAKYH